MALPPAAPAASPSECVEMPDPVLPPVPSPFHKTLVQSLIATKQSSRVTGAETETKTHWQVEGDTAQATAQRSRLVGLTTETKTTWKAVSAKGAGMGVDEFVRHSAVVPLGARPKPVAPTKPAASAQIVAQRTEVTQAETLTETSWKVEGEGACQTMTPTAQQTKLESFDTRTRTKWTLNEKADGLALPFQLPALGNR